MRLGGRGVRGLGAAAPLLLLVAGAAWGEQGPGSRPGAAEALCRETSTAPAEERDEPAASAPTAAARSLPGAAGMRVYVDPESGQLIGPDRLPPQALSPLEQAMLRRDAEGLTEQSLPNGAVVVDLGGRFRNLAVATVDAEGRARTTHCVTSAEAAPSRLEEEPTPDPRDAHGE